MSKAILVIDMPKNCEQCPCFSIGSFYDVCRLAQQTKSFKEKGIPDWCPLRPMPEKKEVCGKYPQPDGITPSYKIGYNACIDEIGGGANETDKETHQST